MSLGTGKVESTASDRIKQLNEIDKVRVAAASADTQRQLITCEGHCQTTGICWLCYKSSD